MGMRYVISPKLINLLALGLSMEALCKPPFSETIEDVEIYMKSIWVS